MKYKSAGLSDVGQKRTNNEDFFVIDAEIGLYLVSDGVGGHNAGEVASQTTAAVVQEVIREHSDSLKRWNSEAGGHSKVARMVEQAVQRACDTVYRKAKEEVKQHGMAATVTLLLLLGNRAVMAHVGDSRLYLKRGNRIHLLSNDHTLVNELVREGVMNREEAASHRAANVLVRAIGQHPSVKVDTLVLDVIAGDTFLLCSDGLSNYLEDQNVLNDYMDLKDLDAASQQLVDLANQKGGKDNITAVMVRAQLDEASRPIELRRTGEIALWQSVLADCPLFADLTYQEIQRAMNFSKVIRVDARETLLAPGTEADAMYIVLAGGLILSRARDHEKRLEPGAIVGATALFKNRPCKVSVVAAEDSQLLKMRGNRIEHLMRSKPHLGVKLLQNLHRRLGDRMEQFKMADLDI